MILRVPYAILTTYLLFLIAVYALAFGVHKLYDVSFVTYNVECSDYFSSEDSFAAFLIAKIHFCKGGKPVNFTGVNTFREADYLRYASFFIGGGKRK